MYKSFDGKSFDTYEELQSYEHTELKRTAIPLEIINVFAHYVNDQPALNRVISMEVDKSHQTLINSAITFPCWIITFADDEAREFHVCSLNQAASYICEHVSKVFR